MMDGTSSIPTESAPSFIDPKKKILFQLLLLLGFIITSREFSSLQGVEEKRDGRMFELKF